LNRCQEPSRQLGEDRNSNKADELTPQALAEMSEERFAEVFQELQARGDKKKLRQLFGA
jgi:hypothetical protein